MKRCPECRRDYYDDSLLYCLDDGTALLDGPGSVDEPETAILSADRISGEHTTRSFSGAQSSGATENAASKKNSIVAGIQPQHYFTECHTVKAAIILWFNLNRYGHLKFSRAKGYTWASTASTLAGSRRGASR